ncbi:MAG: VWA domain-containing protein [Planctomycetes bacterium]|nr:VWA domain-containing protein [Planctomycetota bacterium]
MKRRTGEIQVFSVSFLDVLSCGLGGVLLLLILTLNNNQRAAQAYQAQVKSMQGQMDSSQQLLRTAQQRLQTAQQNAAEMADARRLVDQAQASLVGLKGDVKHVVFVFDTSGSMDTPRFQEHLDFLKNWVLHLGFEKFNVVRFSSGVMPWREGALMDATPDNRRLAAEFIGRFRADGETNTLGALETAFSFTDLDTIVLFSDGAPMQPAGDVLDWLRKQNANRGVVINTVAIGDYFDKEYGDFLQKMASEHHGMFLGR